MMTVTRSIQFAVKARGKRKIVASRPEEPGTQVQRVEVPGRVPRVARLMALAIRYDKLLRDGVVQSQSELAHLAHVTQPRMTQIMNLLHLAPDIQEDLLHLPPVASGRDPLTERDLRPLCATSKWSEQRAAFERMLRRLPERQRHCRFGFSVRPTDSRSGTPVV